MKAIFNKEILLSAVAPAAATAPTRNTVASIEGILFECTPETGGKCRITSYDMEKGFRTTIDADIISEGSVIVNGQNILQIIRSMPDGDICFEADEKFRVKISSGLSSFEIGAADGKDYPSLPLLSGDRNYTLSQHIFRGLISKTAFVAAVNAQKAIFTGVYFNIENGVMKCVSCDGNRLGLAEVDIDTSAPAASFIVPAKILSEIMKMVRDSEDEITVSLARKHVIFRIDGYIYFSRLIDGEYLNYERIIPESFERNAYMNTAAIKAAAERASLVTEDKLGSSSSRTYIKLEFDENVLKISSSSTGGSVYEEIPVSMTGESLVIGFNCRYLLDALKAADDTETICFKMNGSLMGISIEPADSEEKSKSPVRYMLFVMPLRMHG